MVRLFENARHYRVLDVEPAIERAPSPCQGLATVIAEFEDVLAEALAELEGREPTDAEAAALAMIRRRIDELQARRDPTAPCAVEPPLSEAEARDRLARLFGG